MEEKLAAVQAALVASDAENGRLRERNKKMEKTIKELEKTLKKVEKESQRFNAFRVEDSVKIDTASGPCSA